MYWNVLLLAGQHVVKSFTVEADSRAGARHNLTKLPEFIQFAATNQVTITEYLINPTTIIPASQSVKRKGA